MAQAPNITAEDINIMFGTNVTGLINLTQEVMKIFTSRPNGGSGDVINIGSIAGREGYAGGSIYCASKAAVRTFTDALRKEHVATRIRVIEIDPGQAETEFSVVRFYGDKEKADAVYKGVEPLTPDDIAEVVVFAAGRKENVVIADTLVLPNHQVCLQLSGHGENGNSTDIDAGFGRSNAQKRYIAGASKESKRKDDSIQFASHVVHHS
jgi:3-hydroxy acid dehydrogenase/malonic semialdehyde reductase